MVIAIFETVCFLLESLSSSGFPFSTDCGNYNSKFKCDISSKALKMYDNDSSSSTQGRLLEEGDAIELGGSADSLMTPD